MLHGLHVGCVWRRCGLPISPPLGPALAHATSATCHRHHPHTSPLRLLLTRVPTAAAHPLQHRLPPVPHQAGPLPLLAGPGAAGEHKLPGREPLPGACTALRSGATCDLWGSACSQKPLHCPPPPFCDLQQLCLSLQHAAPPLTRRPSSSSSTWPPRCWAPRPWRKAAQHAQHTCTAQHAQSSTQCRPPARTGQRRRCPSHWLPPQLNIPRPSAHLTLLFSLLFTQLAHLSCALLFLSPDVLPPFAPSPPRFFFGTHPVIWFAPHRTAALPHTWQPSGRSRTSRPGCVNMKQPGTCTWVAAGQCWHATIC